MPCHAMVDDDPWMLLLLLLLLLLLRVPKRVWLAGWLCIAVCVPDLLYYYNRKLRS